MDLAFVFFCSVALAPLLCFARARSHLISRLHSHSTIPAIHVIAFYVRSTLPLVLLYAALQFNTELLVRVVCVCVRARLCFLHLFSIEFIAFIVAFASWRYFNIFVVVIAVTVVTVCYFFVRVLVSSAFFCPDTLFRPATLPLLTVIRHFAVYCFASAMFCSTRLIHWIILNLSDDGTYTVYTSHTHTHARAKKKRSFIKLSNSRFPSRRFPLLPCYKSVLRRLCEAYQRTIVITLSSTQSQSLSIIFIPFFR